MMNENKYLLKNGKELIVRSLTEDDAEAMISLMKMADTETRFLSREIGEFNYSAEQEKEVILARGKDANAFWIVGEVDGKIVANCDTSGVSGKQRYRHRAEIAIVVLKEYWGLGIGKILMSQSIAWCKNKNFEQLELGVLSGNQRAMALYKSLGFENFGIKKNAIKYQDGSYADEHIMWLSLK